MSVDAVERFVARLPSAERDLPLLVVDLTAYTPSQALAEARAGTELGRRLQRMIETGRWGTPEETLEALAAERLKRIYERSKWTKIAAGRAYTPKEMLEAVEKRTPLGRRLIKQEMEYLEHLREKYG